MMVEHGQLTLVVDVSFSVKHDVFEMSISVFDAFI